MFPVCFCCELCCCGHYWTFLLVCVCTSRDWPGRPPVSVKKNKPFYWNIATPSHSCLHGCSVSQSGYCRGTRPEGPGRSPHLALTEPGVWCCGTECASSVLPDEAEVVFCCCCLFFSAKSWNSLLPTGNIWEFILLFILGNTWYTWYCHALNFLPVWWA